MKPGPDIHVASLVEDAQKAFEEYPGTPFLWSKKDHFFPDNICVFKRTRHDLMERNGESHRHFIFLAPLTGTGKIIIDGQQFDIRAGHAIVIRPFQVHAYADLSEVFCWIFIRFDADSNFIPPALKRTCYRLTPDSGPRLLSILKFATETRPIPPFQQLLPAWMLELLGSLIPIHPHSEKSSAATLVLQQVESFVSERLQEVISLDRLAEHTGLSAGYLCSMFKRHFGVSAGRYVQTCRMRKACQLLVDGQLPISEVSGQCGFQSPSVFGKAFRREYGMTPRAFRDSFH